MKTNRVLLSSGISYFFSVVFFLFLSVACYGQSTISDQKTILVNQIEQELNSKQYDDCIATCKELENVLISANQSETQMYVDCLFIQVRALYNSQRVPEATSLAERALKIQERITGTNTSIYAGFLTQLGVYYFNTNLGKAAECYKMALRIYENVCGINSNESFLTRGLLASSLMKASMYDEAYKVYKKRLCITEKLYAKESENYVECLLDLALSLHYLGRINEMQSYISQARELARHISFSNKGGYASFLYQCSLLMEDVNRPEAIMALEECLSILDNDITGNANIYISCISMLANLYNSEGNCNEACLLFKKEAIFCKRIYGEKSTRYARALLHVADYLEPSEAYDVQHKALEILKDKSFFKDSSSYVLTLINIARNTSSYAQSLKKAELDERALAINKEALNEIQQAVDVIKQLFGNDHSFMFYARQTLSNILANMFQFKESVLVAKENLKYAESKFGKNSHYYADALYDLSFRYSQAKMPKEAIKYGEECLAIDTKLDDNSSDRCLNLIMGLITDRHSLDGNDSTIVSLYEEYLERLKDNVTKRFGWMNSEERQSFWKNMIYDRLLPVLLSGDNLRQDNQRISKLCFNALQLLKGLLLNRDVNFKETVEKSKDSSIKADYQMLVSKRIEFNDKLKRINYKEENIDVLRKEILKIERSLAQNLSCIDKFNKDICMNYQDVQTHLKNKEVVVDFYKHLGTYFAFVVSYDSNQVNVFEVCSDRDIKKLDKNNCYATDSIYNVIWKPLESVIDTASTVYFIPDGELYSLALESADLTQKRIYHRLSSSRQICLERDSFLGKDAVVYGGIDYDVDSCGQKMNGTPQKCTLRSLRETLEFLPGSQKEAKEISGILSQNGFKVKLLTGQSATEESFKKLSDTSVNVLHVSTHGYCWSQQKYATMVTNNPLLNQGDLYQVDEDLAMIRTGLMFAGANNAFINKVGDTGLDDGILTAKEICNLNLQNVNLVVLSACKSGLGEVSRDGVYGLQRAFKKAGVKSIVMSLWAIDDSVTQDFMVHFYKGLASGLSKEKALLQAKILIKEKYPHSNDWAAFVLLD